MTRLPGSIVRRLVVTLCTATLLAACASGAPPPFRTVTGPESSDVLAGLRGRVVVGDATRTCVFIHTIDSARSRCVPRPVDARGWDSALVPEREDSVLTMHVRPGANVEQPLMATLRRLTDCNGAPRCIRVEIIATWSRPEGGDAYRQPLALSPDGTRVAVVPSSHLLKGPGYSGRIAADARFKGLRSVGELMLVDLRTHDVRDAGIEVVGDQPISWSADGKRLLIVRAEPLDALPAALAAGVVEPVGHPGQGVPVVEEWVVESGATTMLAVGLQPLWSPDDRTVLYEPAHDRLATLDLVDHVQHDVMLPGMSTRYEAIAMAFVAPRKVLYWALPTAGAEPGFTVRNSPLVGPKQMLALKIADLDSGAFATVDAAVDPRARIGYRAD